MAQRLNASTQSLRRDANLPSPDAFSVLSWSVMATDRNNYTGLMELRDAGSTYIYFGTDNDGTSLCFFDNAGGPSSTIATLVPGTPFCWAVTSAGTGATDTIGYYRALGSNSWSTGTFDRASSFTPVRWQFGNDQFTEWFDGSFRNIKAWNEVKSADQLLVESFYFWPQYKANLNFHWALRNASDTLDLSGNARPPTVDGTPVSEDDKVALWVPRKKIFIFGASGTQTYSYTASGGMTLSGASAALRKPVVAAAGGLSFSGAAGFAKAVSLAASGGVTLSGVAAQIRRRAVTAVGGLNFAGASTVSTHEAARIVTASGGLSFGGAASVSTVSGNATGELVQRSRRRRV